MDRFFVDKTTGTFADDLVADGFVRLLDRLLQQQGVAEPDILQTDYGPYYEIRTIPPLDLSRLAAEANALTLAPILRTAKNRSGLPDLPDNPFVVLDFEEESEKRSAFFEAYTHLEGTLKRAYAIGDDENFPFDSVPAPPHAHWQVLRLLNAPPMPVNGYNKLMVQWREVGEAGHTGAVCLMLCQLFGRTPNDLDAVVKELWKPLAKPYDWTDNVSASQFFNPSQGKGINRPLPNSTALNNVQQFWLLEWLKAVGFYHSAFTARLKGADDRKTYVPAVGQASLDARREIQNTFRSKMRFADTAVRSDIFTITRFLKAFIERMEAAQRRTAGEQERALLTLMQQGQRPANFVRGFHAVFYKSLGTAAATMNIAFLNTPGWIEIRGSEDVAIYRTILEEHERIIEQFAENKGEELELLQRYRDFIVANNLDPFFEFTTAYSSWIISQGEKKGGYPPRRLDAANLRRLIMSHEPQLSPILESEGFQNVAYAIRQSTVTAQYRKAQGDRRYDVRYGLGRDLVRQSQYPTEFIAALSDFLHNYNAENAQVMENRSGPYRRSIQTSDIEEITRLIDEYGSDLVAKLLVAFGYARVPRQADVENEASEN